VDLLAGDHRDSEKGQSVVRSLRNVGIGFSVVASRPESLPVRSVPPQWSQAIERALGVLSQLGVFSVVACR